MQTWKTQRQKNLPSFPHKSTVKIKILLKTLVAALTAHVEWRERNGESEGRIDSPLLASSFVVKTIADDLLLQLITKRSRR